ncbi:MAG TPA: ABC transporter permease subunit [Gemmatimonadaceae bacterium]|nr:ABC transporter permease subunit [Gemmatimonadaceae bacterium]
MRAIARGGLLVALVASTVVPFGLLLVASVSRSWFFPAVWPAAVTSDAWALVPGALGGAALVSAGIAVATGVLSCAIGFPIGRAIAALTGWRRHVGAALAFLPIAAPAIAVGTGAQYYFLRVGLGGTWVGVMLAHLIPAAGLASLYFLSVFVVADLRIEDEARTLGARPWQVLVHVTIPAFRRQVAEAVALGFLVSWSQVPLTLLVGGGLVRTLPIQVFSYLNAGQERYAAVGALMLVVPPMVVLGSVLLGTSRAEVVAA